MLYSNRSQPPSKQGGAHRTGDKRGKQARVIFVSTQIPANSCRSFFLLFDPCHIFFLSFFSASLSPICITYSYLYSHQLNILYVSVMYFHHVGVCAPPGLTPAKAAAGYISRALHKGKGTIHFKQQQSAGVRGGEWDRWGGNGGEEGWGWACLPAHCFHMMKTLPPSMQPLAFCLLLVTIHGHGEVSPPCRLSLAARVRKVTPALLIHLPIAWEESDRT